MPAKYRESEQSIGTQKMAVHTKDELNFFTNVENSFAFDAIEKNAEKSKTQSRREVRYRK